MNHSGSRRLVVLTLMLVIGSISYAAAQETSDVTVATIEGSRTYDVLTLTGDQLTGVSLEPGSSAPFAVEVTDVTYARQGYQVTAMLSDLYPYDPSGGTYDCTGTAIQSSQISLNYLPDPTNVIDVSGLVGALMDFSGTLNTTDHLALITSLGIDPNSLIGGTLDVVANDVVAESQTIDNAAAFLGSEPDLPVTVAQGETGAFSGSPEHPECGSADASVTQLSVQTGSYQSTNDLTAWLQSGLDSAFAGAAGDATATTSEAISNGLVEQTVLEEAVRQALIDAGADALSISSDDLSAVMDVMESGALTLDSLLLQSGLYTSFPELQVAADTSAPTGTYKGRMTFTLVDPYPTP